MSPYIKEEDRKKVDELIKQLSGIISNEPLEKQDGFLNYAVSKIIDKTYPLRYQHINRAMGVLECIKQEYYRRVAAGYEDEKIESSGEVYDNLATDKKIEKNNEDGNE